jgi:hypothetical protein
VRQALDAGETVSAPARQFETSPPDPGDIHRSAEIVPVLGVRPASGAWLAALLAARGRQSRRDRA